MIRNLNKYDFNLTNVNTKFILSLTLVMSLILGSEFGIANQSAMAVLMTYPYTNSLYDKAYNNNSTSSYGNTEYNNVFNNNNYTNDDKSSDSYIKSAEFSISPSKDKTYECRTGPFEDLFTISVEFCIAANNTT